MSKVNVKLKLALMEVGMSQCDLAEELGIDDTLLSKYIRGRRPIPHSVAQRISEVLQRDFQDIGL